MLLRAGVFFILTDCNRYFTTLNNRMITQQLVASSGGEDHESINRRKRRKRTCDCASVAKSRKAEKIYCAPGNAGIAEYAECVAIGAMEFEKLAAFAKEKEIDLCIVGMDDPLVGGLVDVLEEAGIRTFGPKKKCSDPGGIQGIFKRSDEEISYPDSSL